MANRIVRAVAGAVVVLALTAGCGIPLGSSGKPMQSGPPTVVGQAESARSIDGNWLENWPGVDYQNVYQVSGSGGTVLVECTYDTSYRFSDMVFDGQRLTFTKVTDIGDGDPYTIHYDLTLGPDGSQFSGTVDNDHGLTGRQITWTRTDLTYGIGVEGREGVSPPP